MFKRLLSLRVNNSKLFKWLFSIRANNLKLFKWLNSLRVNNSKSFKMFSWLRVAYLILLNFHLLRVNNSMFLSFLLAYFELISQRCLVFYLLRFNNSVFLNFPIASSYWSYYFRSEIDSVVTIPFLLRMSLWNCSLLLVYYLKNFHGP